MVEEVQANDESVIQTLEQLTGGLEQLSQQIQQLTQSEQQREEGVKKEQERMKIQEQSYNSGYSDAERSMQPSEGQALESEPISESMDPNIMDDEMLSDLEALKDEELMLMAEQNPELLDMINQSVQ